MKKLSLLLIAIAFIACEGPMGPAGQDGYGTNWYTTSFTIQPNEWNLVGKPGELNSYFFVDKSLNELTNFIYKEGAVIGYIETSKGVKNGLPYVLHLGGQDNNGEFLWTETADFDFYPGGVGFYLTYSDFNTQLRPETAKTFHIVLMW